MYVHMYVCQERKEEGVAVCVFGKDGREGGTEEELVLVVSTIMIIFLQAFYIHLS